jgi:hypothetical protein
MNDPKCKEKIIKQCSEIVEVLKPVVEAYIRIEEIK